MRMRSHVRKYHGDNDAMLEDLNKKVPILTLSCEGILKLKSVSHDCVTSIPLMIMIEKPTEDGRDLRLPILSTDVLIQIQSFLDPKDILSLRKVLIVT